MLNTAKIDALMKLHNLTDEEAARDVGVSRQMFGFIRRNLREPKASVLKRLADRFGVPVDDLFRKDAM